MNKISVDDFEPWERAVLHAAMDAAGNDVTRVLDALQSLAAKLAAHGQVDDELVIAAQARHVAMQGGVQ